MFLYYSKVMSQRPPNEAFQAKIRINTSIGQHLFSFQVVQQWNDLLEEVVLANFLAFVR